MLPIVPGLLVENLEEIISEIIDNLWTLEELTKCRIIIDIFIMKVLKVYKIV